MIFQGFQLSPQRQAHIYASGFLAIITLGTLALIALCIAALWALVELASLLLTATVEACSSIGATYAAADPLVKFLILASLAYLGYRVGRRLLRRAQI
jgi:hypothetical protein